MILSRLYLENYKQFRDPLELLPPEGAVGVVGSNGSGKTTLFEAILWAFFGSRGGGPRFSSDSIPYSGGSAAERSVAEVTLDIGGASYTVLRSLKRGKVEARVLDGSSREVTSGAQEVGGWVQENLLGMDRTAFEATFFARQKELEFFSGVEGVKRQREVARMLGISQVEDAQNLLRADRNILRTEARVLDQQLEETDHEALRENLNEKTGRHEALAKESERLSEELEVRNRKLAEAREKSERLEDLYRKHNAAGRSFEAAVSKEERAAGKVSELSRRLEELAANERTVQELRPQTEGLAEVIAGIEEQEEARRREERLRAAVKEHQRRKTEALRALNKACGTIEALDEGGAVPLAGWAAVFETEDEEEQVRRAGLLLAGAAEANLLAERDRRELEDLAARHEELAKAQKELEESRSALKSAREAACELEEVLRGLLRGGSVEERVAKVREAQESVRRELAQQRGRREAERREAGKLARAREMILASDEHARCPTCQRGFDRDEHAEVTESLERQEEEILARAEEAAEEVERLEAELSRLSDESERTEKVREKVQNLRERLAAARSVREDREQNVRVLAEEVSKMRKGLEGSEPPSLKLLADAARKVERTRELCDARPVLRGYISTYEAALEAAAEHEREAEVLSKGPKYDREAHRELVSRRSGMENVQGRIQTLEARLEERPALEEALKVAKKEEEESAAEAARLKEELARLGFDEKSYVEARAGAVEAEALRDEARDARDSAARDLQRLEQEVSALQKELDRYEKLRKDADEKALEAGSLTAMDTLMSRFYRELTARVRPRLQSEASALVRTLTDGRYERMEFDDNYGVRLFDGLSDAYEISRFSGGEADVVSLSARVALSKMISDRGGSGSLGFIVLDEVFGALDANRRQNVLLALDRLKATFGQIFIISHVADVQESALLDEVWFVEEDEEGKSSVRRLGPDASGIVAGVAGPSF